MNFVIIKKLLVNFPDSKLQIDTKIKEAVDDYFTSSLA